MKARNQQLGQPMRKWSLSLMQPVKTLVILHICTVLLGRSGVGASTSCSYLYLYQKKVENKRVWHHRMAAHPYLKDQQTHRATNIFLSSRLWYVSLTFGKQNSIYHSACCNTAVASLSRAKTSVTCMHCATWNFVCFCCFLI